MKRVYGRAAEVVGTIRVRLGLVLALALLPVLLIGVVQSYLAFRSEGDARRQSLELAAGHSAATARARIEAAGVLLQTLGPGSVGLECARRLDAVKSRLPGYANLIRFDAYGRVACAAGTTPRDPERAKRAWFLDLAAGAHLAVAPAPGAVYSGEPSVLTAVRAEDGAGVFDGAMAAVLTLSSLKPQTANRFLPDGAEIGLADARGAVFSATDGKAFGEAHGHLREDTEAGQRTILWSGKDAQGRRRRRA